MLNIDSKKLFYKQTNDKGKGGHTDTDTRHFKESRFKRDILCYRNVIAEKTGLVVPLQVHDEVDGTDLQREDVIQIKEIMEHVLELKLPVITDVETGPNWGELSPFNFS